MRRQMGDRKVRQRVVVVGAGHNGLAAAFYLSSRGLKVIVLERSDRVGGAACNYRMPCGCTDARGASAFGMLSPQIWRDMRLGERVRILPSDPLHTLISSCDLPLDWYVDPLDTERGLHTFHAPDASSISRFTQDLGFAIDVLKASLG